LQNQLLDPWGKPYCIIMDADEADFVSKRRTPVNGASGIAERDRSIA
jgi:hypothetical protein